MESSRMFFDFSTFNVLMGILLVIFITIACFYSIKAWKQPRILRNRILEDLFGGYNEKGEAVFAAFCQVMKNEVIEGTKDGEDLIFIGQLQGRQKSYFLRLDKPKSFVTSPITEFFYDIRNLIKNYYEAKDKLVGDGDQTSELLLWDGSINCLRGINQYFSELESVFGKLVQETDSMTLLDLQKQGKRVLGELDFFIKENLKTKSSFPDMFKQV
jgi:hypothetical protein